MGRVWPRRLPVSSALACLPAPACSAGRRWWQRALLSASCSVAFSSQPPGFVGVRRLSRGGAAAVAALHRRANGVSADGAGRRVRARAACLLPREHALTHRRRRGGARDHGTQASRDRAPCSTRFRKTSCWRRCGRGARAHKIRARALIGALRRDRTPRARPAVLPSDPLPLVQDAAARWQRDRRGKSRI